MRKVKELNLNTLIYSELLMSNVRFLVTEPNLPCSAVKCVARKTLHVLILNAKKNDVMKSSIFNYLLPQKTGSKERRYCSSYGRITVDGHRHSSVAR